VRPWIITADIHARYTSEDSTQIDGIPASIHDLRRVFTALSDLAKAEDADHLFVVGDLLHDRRTNHSLTLLEAARGLAAIPCANQAVIAGNHDFLLEQETVLDALNGALPLTQPRDALRGPDERRILVRCIPFNRSFDVMRQQVEADDGAFLEMKGTPTNISTRILFIHAPIFGAARGPWDYAGEPGGLPLELFKKYTLTFAGHFHRRQWLEQPVAQCGRGNSPAPAAHEKSTHGSVLYVGSPIALNRADIAEGHGFTVFYPDTLTTKFVPCPGPVYREVCSYSELERLAEQHDPADLVIRAVLPSTDELPKFEEARGWTRRLQTFVFGPKMVSDPEKEKVALAAACSDRAMLGAYIDARGGQPAAELIEAGLRYLGGDAR
jgi:hypothetical protein